MANSNGRACGYSVQRLGRHTWAAGLGSVLVSFTPGPPPCRDHGRVLAGTRAATCIVRMAAAGGRAGVVEWPRPAAGRWVAGWAEW
jgi:hypothetical protein